MAKMKDFLVIVQSMPEVLCVRNVHKDAALPAALTRPSSAGPC